MPKNTLPRSRRAAAPKKNTETRSAQAIPIDASSGDNWHAEVAARRARLVANLDLKDLDEREQLFLATCQMIGRRNTGCTSPFEAFFRGLARSVECGDWPTPDDVADELETFREDFCDMRKHTVAFLEAYPPVGAPVHARATQDDSGTAASGAVESAPPQESAPDIDYREKDWEEKTPRELIYQLECFSPSDVEQRVHLTRAEYIALKEHLVRVRGFIAQEAAREAQSRG